MTKANITTIRIKTETILLKDFLKFSGIISTGGMAKVFLLENNVYVNGQQESRRGRTLRKGDLVEVKGNSIKFMVG